MNDDDVQHSMANLISKIFLIKSQMNNFDALDRI